ncbi:MFS transporter [Escherichia coli]|nr:MFS transporter [Escherichia coli]HBM7597504.1 MFS transporter [Enterobacter hormaechei subsp. xiangfangensis]HCQ7288692.1 MFS transporter [Klebsiella pneumoniae]EHR0314687.1 MFS transporter [Escherichia coli]EHZ9680901.1 MFS transporter [Escherichia coli]
MIAPALPTMAVELLSDPAVISLAVAGYAVVTALVELISGAISDRYGRRPVALVSMAIFILASIGCAASANIMTFLFFRALQAAIAACFSVALVGIKETSSDRDGASRMGYAAMAWALAPMLGPTVGGALDQFLGWRAIFITLALCGTAMLLLSLRALGETAPSLTWRERSYLKSYALLLGSVRFWAYAACMAFSTATLYIFLVGAPLVIGGSSAVLGLYMGLVPTGFIFGSYLTGRFASRFPRGTALIAARALTCAGLLVGLMLTTMGNTDAPAFFLPCMFIGIGNGLTLPLANMGAMSLHSDLSGTAAGLAAAMQMGGGAVIVSIAGILLPEADTHALLAMMLSVALLALFAATVVALLERPLTTAHRPG